MRTRPSLPVHIFFVVPTGIIDAMRTVLAQAVPHKQTNKQTIIYYYYYC